MLHRIFIGRDGVLRSGWVIALFLLVYGAIVTAASSFLWVLGIPPRRQLDAPELGLYSASSLFAALVATAVACRAARQPFGAAGFRHPFPGRQAALGAAVGAFAISVLAAVPAATGHSVLSASTASAAELVKGGLRQLAFVGPQSISEEIILRGVVLQQLVKGTNRWVAVMLTGVVFGLAHAGNPHVTWTALVNVALAGIWFGVLVVRTGSLWIALGLHVSWNWFEGFVWGQPVSGAVPGTALVHRVTAQDAAWTGDDFGPEGSLVATALLVGASAASGWRARSRPAAQGPGGS